MNSAPVTQFGAKRSLNLGCFAALCAVFGFLFSEAEGWSPLCAVAFSKRSFARRDCIDVGSCRSACLGLALGLLCSDA
jgi:hypothetical protein